LRGPVAAKTPAATPNALADRLKAIAIPQPQPGDLIVAVNVHRLNCNSELAQEIEGRGASDTVYFTIIRSLAYGTAKTMKIPIRVGK
jgi:S1-C subfamily serine protease